MLAVLAIMIHQQWYIDILYLMKAERVFLEIEWSRDNQSSVRRSYFSERDKLGQKKGIPVYPIG